MNEYYNLNEFNNDSENLDKLAREINNKKTSMVKKVTDDYESQQRKWKNGIDNLTNNKKYSFLPMNKNNVTNYDKSYQQFNYNGYDKFDNFDKFDKFNDIDDLSFDSFDSLYSNSIKSESDSYFIDSESLDLYLDDAKKSIDYKFEDKYAKNPNLKILNDKALELGYNLIK